MAPKVHCVRSQWEGLGDTYVVVASREKRKRMPSADVYVFPFTGNSKGSTYYYCTNSHAIRVGKNSSHERHHSSRRQQPDVNSI